MTADGAIASPGRIELPRSAAEQLSLSAEQGETPFGERRNGLARLVAATFRPSPGGLALLLFTGTLLIPWCLLQFAWLTEFRADRGVGGPIRTGPLDGVIFFSAVAIGAALIWPRDRRERRRREPQRLSLSVGLALGWLILPPLILGRGWSGVWRVGALGGSYFDQTTNLSGLAFLTGFSAGSPVLFGAWAGAHLRTRVEAVGLGTLLTFLIGRGGRATVVASVLAAVLERATRRLTVLAAAIVLTVLVAFTAAIPTLRVGGSAGDAASEGASLFVRSIDSVSVPQAVQNAGIESGELRFDNLVANARLLVPRALDPGKPTSLPVDSIVLARVLPGRSGASVPYWTAAKLDGGLLGLMVYGQTFGLLLGALVRWLSRASNSLSLAYMVAVPMGAHLVVRHSIVQTVAAVCGAMILATLAFSGESAE